MEALEALRGRRSVRSYRDDSVDKQLIEALIDVAILAPSALNRQPWSFAVIQGRDRIVQLEAAVQAAWRSAEGTDQLAGMSAEVAHHVRQLLDSGFSIFHGAPAVIVVLASTDDQLATVDGALAAENLMLAAHAMGLATCPVGLAQPYFQRPAVLEELGQSPQARVVLVIVLGKAAEVPPVPPRNQPLITWS